MSLFQSYSEKRYFEFRKVLLELRLDRRGGDEVEKETEKKKEKERSMLIDEDRHEMDELKEMEMNEREQEKTDKEKKSFSEKRALQRRTFQSMCASPVSPTSSAQ
jgi:hypothetical protein